MKPHKKRIHPSAGAKTPDLVVPFGEETVRAMLRMAETPEGRELLARPLEHNVLWSVRKFPAKGRGRK